jgi:hypothetical protein
VGPDGPSAYEVVAGYSTTYATIAHDKASSVSVLELGLRRYNFSYDDGAKTSLAAYLKPRYFSFGLAVAPPNDGALRWPLYGKSRLGPFFTWGDYKLGYLGGADPDWRLIVSRQFQLLPGLF